MNLADQMKICLATIFAFYLKSHKFHWNVTGPNYHSDHIFLDMVYKDVFESVDMFGEHIRTLDTFAPGSLSEFASLSKVSDSTSIPSDMDMMAILASDNELVLNQLHKARDLAEQADKYGIVNFLEGRIDYHDNLHWRLNAFKQARTST